MASNEKWQPLEEEGKQVFVRGDFRIVRQPPPPPDSVVLTAGAFWEAFYRGRSVKTSYDLKEVMDYCDILGEQIA